MPVIDRRLFKLCGASAVIAGIAMTALWAANRQTAAHGGRDLSSLAPLGAMLALIGVLSWLEWTAAIVVIAAAAGAIGIWLIVGAALSVPFPWTLLNIVLGAFLLAPSARLGQAWLGRRRARPNGGDPGNPADRL